MEDLTLKDFISNTLVEIAEGISQANEQLSNPEKQKWAVYSLRDNRGDSNKIPGIKFDIAVKAAKKQNDKAGFVVALAAIGGGANTSKEAGTENNHRISFEVGVERHFTQQ